MKGILGFLCAICALLFAFGCSQSEETAINDTVGINPAAAQQSNSNANDGTMQATGGGGGVKVSNTDINCGVSTKETNNLTGENTAEAWVLATGATGNQILKWYRITCKNGHSGACEDIRLSACGASDPNYFHNNFRLEGGSPTRCTFTLYNDDACTSSSSADSWRQ